ncbi:hypothetical protein V3481_011029 [Fusarium oxysporum f. sp. vasinfectum]
MDRICLRKTSEDTGNCQGGRYLLNQTYQHHQPGSVIYSTVPADFGRKRSSLVLNSNTTSETSGSKTPDGMYTDIKRWISPSLEAAYGRSSNGDSAALSNPTFVQPPG